MKSPPVHCIVILVDVVFNTDTTGAVVFGYDIIVAGKLEPFALYVYTPIVYKRVSGVKPLNVAVIPTTVGVAGAPFNVNLYNVLELPPDVQPIPILVISLTVRKYKPVTGGGIDTSMTSAVICATNVLFVIAVAAFELVAGLATDAVKGPIKGLSGMK